MHLSLAYPQSPAKPSKGSSMHTIVLATQKGGSGKSTLAIGLAVAAKHVGHIVRLVETDTKGTLSNWQSRRGIAEPLVDSVYRANDIEHRLQSLARGGVTLAIVDTPGGLSAATTAAIRHADLCLIPARPTVVDIEVTASTLEIVRAWRRPFAFVLNQTAVRGQRIDNAATALADHAARDLADVLAKPFIGLRNDHQDALGAGLAVGEYAPASKSADEIGALWRWVEARLNGGIAAGARRADDVEQYPIMLTPILSEEVSVAAAMPELLEGRADAEAWDAGL
jgi:chromosome partitioning protein